MRKWNACHAINQNRSINSSSKTSGPSQSHHLICRRTRPIVVIIPMAFLNQVHLECIVDQEIHYRYIKCDDKGLDITQGAISRKPNIAIAPTTRTSTIIAMIRRLPGLDFRK